MNDHLIGKVIAGRYHVSTFLGKGGMAEVYKVWDKSRMANLAIKVLNPNLAGDAVVDRFRAEASALARLQHPNIVRFYSLERDGDTTFIVMDFVEGYTLREELQARRIVSPQRTLQIMRNVCGALNYAHEMGYVHCDIKPANIMINKNGSALVSDFGIAQLAGSASDSIARGGTAGYMSPEQIRGETPTRASDIYALGVLLFEMLTGVRPFTGQTTQTAGSTSERVRWEQAHLSPPSPRHHNPSISSELERIILRCLEKDAAKRYPSIQSLLSALEQSLLRDASRAGVEYVHGPVAQSEGPLQHVVTLPAQNHRAKKAWVWLLVVIPVIVLLVLITGEGGGSPSKPIPPFAIRPYNSSMDKDADCIICQLVDWEAPKAPGTYKWDVSFPANTPVFISLGWCAVDQPTLDANWPLIRFELIIDDYQIDLDQLTFETITTSSNNPCYTYTGVLTNWSRGNHQYNEILYFDRTLSDGWNTYEVGEYISNFMVEVQ